MAKEPDAMLATAALVVAEAGPLDVVVVAEPVLDAVAVAAVEVERTTEVDEFPVGFAEVMVERVVEL